MGMNDGYGYGYSDGSGDGYGYGYGYGYSDGSGDGYGYGSGYGDGDGSGDGYGYGDGDGDGKFNLCVPRASAWSAYHYVRKQRDAYLLRDGGLARRGQLLEHDGELEMCSSGLHASLTRYDAHKYAPPKSVLTRVEISGVVILSQDKLVATQRTIMAELDDDE